jgi:Flp pilus assembly protein TadD
MFKEKQIPLIYLLLTAATLVAFWQVNHCDFIDYDDPSYVVRNIHVQNGFTVESIRWAFTTGHAANWHPLTWMSHMLDVQLFGLEPHGHHLTNLLFHIANVLLLFFVFHRMTKALWQSFFVAALFAVHPIHVESVAWVAERKDVLSTFFWMLTLVAYSYYAQSLRPRTYLAVFLFFALGLMSKPMVVTLPFVLLLIDYWPLRRFQQYKPAQAIGPEVGSPVSVKKRKGKSARRKASGSKPAPEPIRHPNELVQEGVGAQGSTGPGNFRSLIIPLLREKIPFFALAALSCVITVIAQQKAGSVASIEGFPPGVRIANAIVSYVAYIGKMLWPDNLAVFYPYPRFLPLWQVMGAFVGLTAISFMVVRNARRFPYLALGWLWFAGTLVPVIGIVQVGNQAMADRYSYIPLIGLFVMAAWGIPEFLSKLRRRKEVLTAFSATTLACFIVVTWTQVGYWRNSIALFDHALKVTGDTDLILQNRGSVFSKLGNYKLAIEDYNKAIEINPRYLEAYTNRGATYVKLGNFEQAILDFGKAAELNPQDADTYYNRGVAYNRLGNYEQAILDYDRAIEINPNFANAYYNRGVSHEKLGDHRRAHEDLETAARLGKGKVNDLPGGRGMHP